MELPGAGLLLVPPTLPAFALPSSQPEAVLRMPSQRDLGPSIALRPAACCCPNLAQDITGTVRFYPRRTWLVSGLGGSDKSCG